MTEVTDMIKTKALDLHEKNLISEKDKTLITGLNANNNMMHSPVFRAVIPYAYPLFKIHKLSLEQIQAKVVPPSLSDWYTLHVKVLFIALKNGQVHSSVTAVQILHHPLISSP